MWEWFWFILPWEFKLVFFAALATVVYLAAGAFLGFDKVNRYIVPIVLVVVTLGLVNRFQQQGWKAKEEADKKDAEAFKDDVAAIRDRAEDAVAKESEQGTLRDDKHGRFRD